MHDKAEGTRDMYRVKGRRIFMTLGDPFVHEVTRDMLSSYIERRLSDDPEHGGAAAHTVQKEMITIRRALKEAHERGVLAVMPPLPRFSAKYRPKETWLTPAELEAMLKAVRPERHIWVWLAVLAGGSAGEVERLTWDLVDLERGILVLPGTKRETRRRPVAIGPALRLVLEAVPDERRFGPVAGRWANVRRDLHAACDKVGVKRVSPNDLRRTFASWLVQAGIERGTVANLMGHSSTRMVEKVYGRLSSEVLARAVAALPTFPPVTPVAQTPARLALQAPYASTADPLRTALEVPRDGVEPPTRGFSVPVEDGEGEQ